MPKHNNVIPNAHFHKDWKLRVRCWFDQAPKKQARRLRREKKAKAIFPRPVAGALRPIVHPPTAKYAAKLRLGRGFTLEELKVRIATLFGSVPYIFQEPSAHAPSFFLSVEGWYRR